jgi:hypothetical protein
MGGEIEAGAQMTPAAAIARRCLMPAIERPEPAPLRRRAGKFRPCVINGTRYRSLSDAGRATGLHPVSVAHRCASSQWPDWLAEGIEVVGRCVRCGSAMCASRA